MTGEKESLLKKLALLGPAAILVSSSMGPGTIASSILGGSCEGYGLLWIVALSGFLGAAVSLLGGRVYAATKKTPMVLMKDTVGGVIAYPLFIITACAVYYVIIAEGNLLAHTTSLMFPAIEGGVNNWIVVPLIVLATAVVFTFGFKRVVFFCSLFTGLMALLFFVNLFFLDISWADFLQGLVPSAPQTKFGFLALAGILGGSASGLVIIGYSYIVANKGWDDISFIKRMRWDQIFFYGVLFGVFSVGIYLSGASVLYGVCIVGDATEAAMALEPLVGPASLWFFLVGLFMAVFTTIGALSTLLCYFLAEMVGVRPDLDDKRYKMLLFGSIMVAVIGPFVGGLPAMQYMALAMTVFLLAGVLFYAVYLYVSNSKKIMGTATNRWYFNIVLFFLFTINLFFGIMAVLKMVAG